MSKLSLAPEGRERLLSAIKYLMNLAEVIIPGEDGEARKNFVIDQINVWIDIPVLSESTERVIIETIVDTLFSVLPDFRD